MIPTVLRALCGILLLALAPAVAAAADAPASGPYFQVLLPKSFTDGPQDG